MQQAENSESIMHSKRVLVELLKVSLSPRENNVGEESTVAVSQEEKDALASFFTRCQYLHNNQRKTLKIPVG